jgi:hypothetical protein
MQVIFMARKKFISKNSLSHLSLICIENTITIKIEAFRQLIVLLTDITIIILRHEDNNKKTINI